MRPDDVGPGGGPNPAPQFEKAPLAAGTPVENSEVDRMAPLAERELELAYEHAEIGVGRPRIHLGDEQDPHGSLRAARAADAGDRLPPSRAGRAHGRVRARS